MGYEVECRVRVTDRAGAAREADARVLLETDELIVRGDAHVRIPRSTIRRVIARADGATVEHTGGRVHLLLPPSVAALWIAKAEQPVKSLLDKMGILPRSRVWVIGRFEKGFLDDLAGRASVLTTGRRPKEFDIALLRAERESELRRIATVSASMGQGSALWVIHPKGASGLADTLIFAAAVRAGLTYTKVVRFSETHTGEKLVPRSVKGGGAGERRAAPVAKSSNPR